MAPGQLGRCDNTRLRLQFVPMLSSAWGCRELVSSVLAPRNFQSWGQAQKSEVAVLFNKDIGLLGKWCHNIANGAGFVLQRTSSFFLLQFT